jgi:NADH-quinone oxidoreductase subunit C
MSPEELSERFSRLFPRAEPAASASAAGVATETDPGPAVPETSWATDYARRGCHLDVTVAPAEVVTAARMLDQQGFALDAITGVDWIEAGQMEVIYDYFHPTQGVRVAVRARAARDKAEFPTVSPVFPGADWHERETHELLGIRFIGHPNLVPLLLPEDATFHPLRKDFTGE